MRSGVGSIWRAPLRLLLVGACMFAGVTLASPRVEAQHSHGRRSRRREAREARTLFDAGVSLADRQQWSEALAAFRHSQELVPQPATQLNIAQVLLRLGRYREAVPVLESCVALATDGHDNDRVARANTLLAEVRGRLVTVSLTDVPPGAQVTVDGTPEAGDGATRTLTLDPGARHFEVRASDGRTDRFELTLASGAPATHAVSFTPTSAAANASVTVTVPTMTGALAQAAFERGRAALAERRYDQAAEAFHEAAQAEPSPGTWYWLGITLRTMQRYSESLAAFERYLAAPAPDAPPERLVQVRLAMAEMQRSLARLAVTVTPPNATLQIDARPRTIEAAGIPLDPGSHVIELQAPGHAPLRQEIELRPGGQLVLNLRLNELPGRIAIEPSLASASVTIDGQSTGHGRIEREMPPGEHLVELRAPDHQPWSRRVRVTAGGLVRVDATLVPIGRPGWVVPVAVAGSLVAAAGVTAIVLVSTTTTEAPISPSLGNFSEAIRVR